MREDEPLKTAAKKNKRGAPFLSSSESRRCCKGRYLYDVRVRTDGGVTQYVTNSTDRLRECVRVPKIRKFCGRHLSIAPLKATGRPRENAAKTLARVKQALTNPNFDADEARRRRAREAARCEHGPSSPYCTWG